MASNGYELDWDSTIEKDEQQFTLVDEGDYSFIVDHIDRTYVGNESEKYAGAKMATVYLNLQLPEQDEVQLRENFILHSNFAWKIGSLLVSVGASCRGCADAAKWSRTRAREIRNRNSIMSPLSIRLTGRVTAVPGNGQSDTEAVPAGSP